MLGGCLFLQILEIIGIKSSTISVCSTVSKNVITENRQMRTFDGFKKRLDALIATQNNITHFDGQFLKKLDSFCNFSCFFPKGLRRRISNGSVYLTAFYLG